LTTKSVIIATFHGRVGGKLREGNMQLTGTTYVKRENNKGGGNISHRLGPNSNLKMGCLILQCILQIDNEYCIVCIPATLVLHRALTNSTRQSTAFCHNLDSEEWLK